MIALKFCTVEVRDGAVWSTFADGTSSANYPPEDDGQFHALALMCGFTDPMTYCLAHEATHHLVCEVFFDRPSYVVHMGAAGPQVLHCGRQGRGASVLVRPARCLRDDRDRGSRMACRDRAAAGAGSLRRAGGGARRADRGVIHRAGRFDSLVIRQFRCDALVLAQDRAGPNLRSAFVRAKKLATNYGARLRKIARHVDDLVRGFDASTLIGRSLIQTELRHYGATLQPWAEAAAERMVAEVVAADRQSWRRLSAELGRGVEQAVASAPIAPVIARMQAEQVGLITSLPTEAAEHVGRIVTEGLSTGRRSDDIAREIYEIGSVTRSRATLIATTETGRAATTLTMARAQHAGSSSYRWRTSRDGAVRHDHEILDGLVFKWSDPPVADRRTGARAHPGCIYRCRCWPEPLFDGD